MAQRHGSEPDEGKRVVDADDYSAEQSDIEHIDDEEIQLKR